MQKIADILEAFRIHPFLFNGLTLVYTLSAKKGQELTQAILERVVDQQTVLFLSGGKTPKPLYESLVQSKKLQAAAAALVDERFGEKFHENSNEKLLQGSGLLDYFQKTNTSFYSILRTGLDRQKTAEEYDETVRFLFHNFPKSVALMGMGDDGHTAGIPADFARLNLDSRFNLNKFVVEYNDQERFYKERITLTFSGLSMIDLFVVLVLGKEKKKALKLMFEPPTGGGSEEEIPARFFLRPEIAKKTLLITDQKV